MSNELKSDAEILLKRIEQQERLLVCYRTGRRPSEKLLDDLVTSRLQVEEVKARIEQM